MHRHSQAGQVVETFNHLDKQRDIAIFTDIFIAAGINDVGRSSRGRNGLSCGKKRLLVEQHDPPLRRYG
ncbi:hypothetical protein BN426_2879 [Klebsiella pneumoniae subsp. pneumoniae ST258-K26BO]|nr:hypothetical protein BN426_2879 [Klebsiella pneumoniae subsp. pneumoniae ST258-K26BO]